MELNIENQFKIKVVGDYGDYLTISDCLFTGNLGNYAVEFEGPKSINKFGDLVIRNCTIVDNENGIWDNCEDSTSQGPQYFDPALVNTIIYNNSEGNTYSIGWTFGMGWSVTASHCDIEGVDGWNETPNEQGNLSKEPLFVNTAFGEYHLSGSGNDDIMDGGENISGTDIDGQERSIGTSTDIGSDEYNPFRVIEGITKETNNNIKIDWNTVSGIDEYRVYSSTDEYGEEMTWELEYTWTSGATEWTDEIDCETIDFKYYKVAYTTALGAVIESDAVGFYNVEVTKGTGAQNTISCPFWLPDNTLDGDFGAQLSQDLSSTISPTVKKWDRENGWDNSTYNGDDWSDGTISIKPGESFDLTFGGGASGTEIIAFLGHVPQNLGYTFIVGKDQPGAVAGFSHAYPIYTTLNDIPFIYLGCKGGTSYSESDKIVEPNSGYSGWTEILWLRSDGKWRTMNDQQPSESQLEIKPCKGFYYKKQDAVEKAVIFRKPY